MESLDVTEVSVRVIGTLEYVMSTRPGREEWGAISRSVHWGRRGREGGSERARGVLYYMGFGGGWGRYPHVRVRHEGVNSVLFLFCLVLGAFGDGIS